MTDLVDDDGLVLAESGPWAVCIGDGPRFVVGVDCVIFETRAEADRHARGEINARSSSWRPSRMCSTPSPGT